MSGKKNNDHHDVRRQVQLAISDIMIKKNIVDISVGNIVSEVNISRSTFYRYYNSINDVIREIEDILLEEICTINKLALIEKRNGQKAESFINNYARANTMKKYEKYIIAITGPNGDSQFRYKAIKQIKEYLNERYNFDKNKNYEILVEFIAAGFYQIISYWIFRRPDLSAEEFLKIQYETFQEINNLYNFEK